MIQNTSMVLIPACYSKAKKKKDFKDLLFTYPKQLCNTKEAFEGKVFELCERPGGPVGSLPEYYDHFGAIIVFIKAEDGFVKVTRKANGDWETEQKDITILS